MVEVFKTNVSESAHASMLVELLHKSFPTYAVNFDLHDCDKILRIKSSNGAVESSPVVELLAALGFKAEVLPDDPPVISNKLEQEKYFPT